MVGKEVELPGSHQPNETQRYDIAISRLYSISEWCLPSSRPMFLFRATFN